MIKRFALLGAAAPVVYVFTVILGGALREDCSHMLGSITWAASTKTLAHEPHAAQGQGCEFCLGASPKLTNRRLTYAT